MVWAGALCLSDLRARRLPNVLTLPAGALALAAAIGWPALLPGIGIWVGLYLVVFLLGGLGAGDVKLAVPLGALVSGLAGWPAVLMAVLSAQIVTVVWAAIARSPTVPHAPPMFLGALAAICLAR